MRRGKRYLMVRGKVEKEREYGLEEAIELLKSLDGAKFDETFELVVNLGIDPRKSDQMVRGTFSLPHGIGKEKRVVVFAEGGKAEEARRAGAVEVGGAELVKRIEDGWLEFDVAIAVPEMMRQISRLGRILGPKGLMPSSKTGTITQDVGEAVGEFRAGKVEYRADGGGVIHLPVGKKSFPTEAIRKNIEAFLEHLKRSKPPGVRGKFIRKAFLCTTMSPAVRLEVE